MRARRSWTAYDIVYTGGVRGVGHAFRMHFSSRWHHLEQGNSLHIAVCPCRSRREHLREHLRENCESI